MNTKPQIIRSQRRKTIAIEITDDGVIVRAPQNASDEVIQRVLNKKQQWINDALNSLNQRDPHYAPRRFINGEGFLYLGKYYKLKIVEDQDQPLILKDRFYLSRRYLPQAKQVFIDWYKNAAKEKITKRVEYYAEMRGLSYNKINITDAQRRWGSCTKGKNLNFAWRLIMAPLPVIDYVVVHELIHLIEPNHSPEFWRKVYLLMPDYEKYSNWLKENGHLLRL